MNHKEVVHSNNHCWNRTINDRVLIEHLFTIHVTLEMRHVDKQLPFWQHHCSKLKTIQNLPATPQFLSWYNTPLLPSPLIYCTVFSPSILVGKVSLPIPQIYYIHCQKTKTTRENPVETRCLASNWWHSFSIQASNPYYTDRVGHERGAQTMVANFDWIGYWIGLLSLEE